MEHSIALSGLIEDFEDILLEINYSKESNRIEQKALWEKEAVHNFRATDVYNFLLKKDISKAIVAQHLSKHLLENKT
ncbi:hypothetical protein R0J91_16660, partial [Micrococcus sp. SIMBA_131]